MPKLNPESQIKLTKTVIKGILEHYNVSVQSFAIPKGGIANATALVTTANGRCVVRVYRQNRKTLAHIKQELAFMKLLQKHKLPVPKVFPNKQNKFITQYKKDGRAWQCVVMEWMSGNHTEHYSPTLLKNLARTQAKMHKLGANFAKHQPKTNRLDVLKEREFVKDINFSKLKKPNVIEFLNRAKKYTIKLEEKLPRGFNHLDYDHANVLVERDKLSAILDFDDLTYSPLIVDLGYTLWDVLFENGDIQSMRAYLREYQKLRQLQKLEKQYLRNILLFRNYAIGSFEVRFWGENGMYVKKFLAFEKLLTDLEIKSLVE
jgi:Ser/Thr protein kinase RdoA (MazF antagonist)